MLSTGAFELIELLLKRLFAEARRRWQGCDLCHGRCSLKGRWAVSVRDPGWWWPRCCSLGGTSE